jgi:glycine/D-amino acid oxidase-like deaminating enzyme
MSALPGKPGSCWAATAPEDRHPVRGRHLRVETVAIGGSTAAFRLAREGRSAAVLKARRVGRQVAGRSTARDTTQRSPIDHHLAGALGVDRARLHADANRTACDTIPGWAQELGLGRGLGRRDAYVCAVGDGHRPAPETEAEAVGAAPVRPGFEWRAACPPGASPAG